MTSLATEYFDRITRARAPLLTSLCAVVLLLNLPAPRDDFGAMWFDQSSNRKEADVDAALQQAATGALAGREGAIIVMDPQTGRVRALVDPESAYAQASMPGSAIKPFTALAALRAGLIDENSRTVCPGRFNGLNFSLPCVHADHLPPFSPAEAIAYSCNYYFATLGQRLGREKLIDTLRPFGFGQVTGFDPNEAPGTIRRCEPGNRARVLAKANHVSEQADCSAREAVGESNDIQVTPIQLLTAYAALINGGRLWQPQIAAAENFRLVERATIDIASPYRTIIAEGMAGAIRYGTARSAKLDSLPLTIIGKTGTALPAKGFHTNGWFVGFAAPPQNNREFEPSAMKIAVIVFVARAHGAQAAELSKPIFEAYANALCTDGSVEKSKQNRTSTGQSEPRDPQSMVKVHLVSQNVTQELSLEEYVLGVMRAEGSMETEPEALKALAIAIRTYALKNSGRHAKDGYDFCSTTHCQRFVLAVNRGSSPTVREGSLVTAVKATEGQILLNDHNQLVDSYFGASCGGNTANIQTLWGKNPPAYLRGAHDEYCESGPHATWTDTIARADLLRALQSDVRTDVGNRLDQVIISKRDETGRAEFITLDGEHRKTLRGWDFKIIVGRVLGWNVLKSSRFEVSRAGSNFIFRGSGFGHGLGLCQEGAHAMAAQGMSYQRILEKYFPGTSVRRDAETRRRGDAANRGATQGWRSDVFLRNLRTIVSRVANPRVSASPRPRVMVLSSEHFRVTYPADVDRRDANLVLTTLESARADCLHRASAASISVSIAPLEIRLNDSTGDFTARTGQPWWAAAATKGNRIELQPVGVLKRRGVLTTTLRHELAHAVIDAVGHNRAPRWLEEGFAIYLAGEGQSFSLFVRGGLLGTEELEKKLQHPRTQQEMRALYADAYALVNELIRNKGEASVWKRLATS